jgi:hypothetical protein
LKSVDGSGLHNEEFRIRLEKEGKVFYEKDHSTNSIGYISFTFDPNQECNKECEQSALNEKPQHYTIKVTA